MLVLGLAIFTVGCFVSEGLLLVAGFTTAAYVIGQWRGNATSQLILSLAARLDDEKDDALHIEMERTRASQFVCALR